VKRGIRQSPRGDHIPKVARAPRAMQDIRDRGRRVIERVPKRYGVRGGLFVLRYFVWTDS
jgi:hypothetical protein